MEPAGEVSYTPAGISRSETSMATNIATAAEFDSALSGGGEFAELEAKIERVAAALLQARRERDQAVETINGGQAAQEKLAGAHQKLQAAYEKLQASHTQAEAELVMLRKERHEVRQRVTRLLQQLESVAS